MSWMVASVHFHIEISSLQMTYSEKTNVKLRTMRVFSLPKRNQDWFLFTSAEVSSSMGVQVSLFTGHLRRIYYQDVITRLCRVSCD